MPIGLSHQVAYNAVLFVTYSLYSYHFQVPIGSECGNPLLLGDERSVVAALLVLGTAVDKLHH